MGKPGPARLHLDWWLYSVPVLSWKVVGASLDTGNIHGKSALAPSSTHEGQVLTRVQIKIKGSSPTVQALLFVMHIPAPWAH